MTDNVELASEPQVEMLRNHLTKSMSLMANFDENFDEISSEIEKFTKELTPVVDNLVALGNLAELESLELLLKETLEKFTQEREKVASALLNRKRSAKGINKYMNNSSGLSGYNV